MNLRFPSGSLGTRHFQSRDTITDLMISAAFLKEVYTTLTYKELCSCC
jgi:hypothetical protein